MKLAAAEALAAVVADELRRRLHHPVALRRARRPGGRRRGRRRRPHATASPAPEARLPRSPTAPAQWDIRLLCRFGGCRNSGHSGGDFVRPDRTPRSSPYGSRAQSDRIATTGGGRTAGQVGGQDGRISPRFVGSPSVHQGGEPSSRRDIRRSGRFRGCRPRRRSDRQAITTRRGRTPPTDDRGVSMIVMAGTSAHTPPRRWWRVGRCRAADRTCTTRQERDARHAPLGGVHSAPERTGSVSAGQSTVGRCWSAGGLSGERYPPGSAGQTSPRLRSDRG